MKMMEGIVDILLDMRAVYNFIRERQVKRTSPKKGSLFCASIYRPGTRCSRCMRL